MAETQPGGLYEVDGKLVDANGNETKRRSKADADAGGDTGGNGALAGIDFASDEAAEAAAEAELTVADFKGVKASGAGGYTKADVVGLSEKKQAE